jgi:carbamoyltransferase
LIAPYILGISAYYHDSAASLIKGNEIVASAQEERFTRKKNDASFPIKAILYCLEEANISLSDIQYVTFYEKPLVKFERLIDTVVDNAPWGFLFYIKSMPVWLKRKLFIKNDLIKQLKAIDKSWDKTSLLFSDHHLSHMASAFFASPFKKSMILTIDGVGEWTTTSMGIGDGNNISVDKNINFPNSLGLLYSAFTQYLGFKVNSGEYKVMGLAPYGKPIYADLIEENLITLHEDGSFKLNMTYFGYTRRLSMINSRFEKLFGQPARAPESRLYQFHKDIASSIQVVLEEAVVNIVNHMIGIYGLDTLTMAGGVALNCVSNSSIMNKTNIKNFWIQPASGDAGGSLGAALTTNYIVLDYPRDSAKDMMKNTFLGPSFTNNDIENVLVNEGIEYEYYENDKLYKFIAEQIDNEMVIGWFQGRMEFGPRSLGNRSILAKATSPDMQKELNLKVKFRESFRPFAPSVIREFAKDYFTKIKDYNIESPYMLFTYSVANKIRLNDKVKNNEMKLDASRSLLQATTHVDFTSRIQTVTRKGNSKFYDLLAAVGATTGHPVVVNTSFNVRGEPIVCTPQDAISCFKKTNIDVLVLENFVVTKSRKNDQS